MAAPENYPAPYPPDQASSYPAQPGQPAYPAQGYGYDQPQQGYYEPPADQSGYPPQPGYTQQPPGYTQQPPGYPQQPSGYQGYPTQAPAYQQTSTATVVVAQQPAVVTQVAPGIKPNNYLILSIINILFCFFILGIIALIFSLQVDSAWTSGQYAVAHRNSNNARTLNYIGIGLGIAGWVIVGIIVVVRIVLSVAFI